MGQNELLAKLNEIKELQVMQEELEAQLDALKDEVKAEMVKQGVEKLLIGSYKVAYTKYASHRFDSTAFKTDHKARYEQYTKTIEARRFTIS